MSFNKPTGCGNIAYFVRIDNWIFQKMDTDILDFSNKCDLQWRLRSSKRTLKCHYHHTTFNKNRTIIFWIQASTKVFCSMLTFSPCAKVKATDRNHGEYNGIWLKKITSKNNSTWQFCYTNPHTHTQTDNIQKCQVYSQQSEEEASLHVPLVSATHHSILIKPPINHTRLGVIKHSTV